MKLTPTNETTTVISTFAVEGVEKIHKQYAKTVVFQPDSVAVTTVNGKVTHIVVSGPRILKDGTFSDRKSESYGTYELRATDTDTPEWIRNLATLA